LPDNQHKQLITGANEINSFGLFLIMNFVITYCRRWSANK